MDTNPEHENQTTYLTDGIDSYYRHWRTGYAQAMHDVMGTLNRYRKI